MHSIPPLQVITEHQVELLVLYSSFPLAVSHRVMYLFKATLSICPSCLENPRDEGAWWAAICGVAQSQTWLKRLSSSSSTPEWSSGFPYFLQFKSEFGNKELRIWATVSSQSCFCWLYRASPSLSAKHIINLISVLTIWWCPCVVSLVFLEEGVCYDQCILLANFY